MELLNRVERHNDHALRSANAALGRGYALNVRYAD